MSTQYHFYIQRLERYATNPVEVEHYPAFILEEDSWDDYAVCSMFRLTYLPDKKSGTFVGRVKIVVEEQVPSNDWSTPARTASFLPNPFTSLDDVRGCSLGQEEDYYIRLMEALGSDEEVMTVLRALRDCAIFPAIYETANHYSSFHSLVRFDDAERLLRTAKRIINRQDLAEMYQFEYHFHVPYNGNEDLSIRFDFRDEDDIIPRRLYAIIGENGTGKTYLLNHMPYDYIAREEMQFNHRLPLYSKIIKVSTSFYDDYPEPPMSETSDFVYCGFRTHRDNDDRRIKDIMQERIALAIEKIKRKSLADGERKLYPILQNFLPATYVEAMCDESYNFQIDKILGVVSKMSSGECNMFFMICDILANIRFDSLILFDEPEVHMHPNAITVFMNIVYSILDQYKSFAIITTHSPLIVREILGENVYVMERNDDMPVIRKIGMESFAANLTDLYNEVFSNKDTKHYYQKILAKMKSYGMTSDEVLEQLHSEALDPNLNMRLMIMNMFDADHEEN